MKKFVVMVMLIALSLTSFACAQEYTTKVVSVTDSNNIITEKGTLRLNCAECPVPGQPYGAEALKALENLIVGKQVDVHVVWQDHSNRDVSKLTVGGKDVALDLAKAGLAWYDSRFQQDSRIQAAVEAAKAQKIGLWSQPNPVAPWTYTADQSGVRPDLSKGTTNIGGQGYGAPPANQDLDAGTSWEQTPMDEEVVNRNVAEWDASGYYNPNQYGGYWYGAAAHPAHRNFCHYCGNYHQAGACRHGGGRR